MNNNMTFPAPLRSRADRLPTFAASGNSGFEILIRAEGVELMDRLREAIGRKIGRVRQYAPEAIRARVLVQRARAGAARRQYRVLVVYELPGNDLTAEHVAHEPRAALDLVAEKIERRLRRRKTAFLANRVRHRRSGRPLGVAGNGLGSEMG